MAPEMPQMSTGFNMSVAALVALGGIAIVACRREERTLPAGTPARVESLDERGLPKRIRFDVELRPAAGDAGLAEVWVPGPSGPEKIGELTRMHRETTLAALRAKAVEVVKAAASHPDKQLYGFIRTRRDLDPWDAESAAQVLHDAGFRDIGFDGMRLWKGDPELGRPIHTEDRKPFRDSSNPVMGDTPSRR
ncbi:MAG: hypothetical protein HMLKMBBP_03370 [Planctomycetes bacterium]|nr:hypothetical protein [Planctomycetota bacterium]